MARSCPSATARWASWNIARWDSCRKALLNYLVRLGWSHGDQELFTREEMMAKFDFDHVSASPARFDMEKAYWVNHQYLKSVDPKRVAPEFKWHLQRVGIDVDALGATAPALDAVIAAQAERCKTLVEMAEKSKFFFAPLDGYVEKDATKHLTPETAPVLDELRTALAALTEWTAPVLHAAVCRCSAKRVAWRIGKVALTGARGGGRYGDQPADRSDPRIARPRNHAGTPCRRRGLRRRAASAADDAVAGHPACG